MRLKKTTKFSETFYSFKYLKTKKLSQTFSSLQFTLPVVVFEDEEFQGDKIDSPLFNVRWPMLISRPGIVK